MVFSSNSQISKRKLILMVYLREDNPNAIPPCPGDKNAIWSLATKLRRPWGLHKPALGIYIPSLHRDLAYESLRHGFMFHWQIFVITKPAGPDRSSIFARIKTLEVLKILWKTRMRV